MSEAFLPTQKLILAMDSLPSEFLKEVLESEELKAVVRGVQVTRDQLMRNMETTSQITGPAYQNNLEVFVNTQLGGSATNITSQLPDIANNHVNSITLAAGVTEDTIRHVLKYYENPELFARGGRQVHKDRLPGLYITGVLPEINEESFFEEFNRTPSDYQSRKVKVLKTLRVGGGVVGCYLRGIYGASVYAPEDAEVEFRGVGVTADGVAYRPDRFGEKNSVSYSEAFTKCSSVVIGHALATADDGPLTELGRIAEIIHDTVAARE